MGRKSFLKTFTIAAANGPMVLQACKKSSGADDGTTTTAGGFFGNSI